MKGKKGYLSAAEASEYTGISKAQLSKLRQQGRGCPYSRIGDSPTKALIRYKVADLDAWMESHSIRTTGGL